MKLAVLCLDTLGDLTLRQPLLRGLLDAGREVTLVVRPLCEPLVPFVDPRLRIISVGLDPYAPIGAETREGLARLMERLLGLEPDLVVAAAYSRTYIDEWLLRHAGSVATAGFAVRPAAAVAGQLRELDPESDADKPPSLAVAVECAEDVPEPDKNNELLGALLGQPLAAYEPSLSVPRERLDEAAATLSRLGLRPGRYVFGCPGGTANNPLKGWPIEGYASLVEHVQRNHGLPVLLSGLPAESPRIEAIVEAAKARGVRAPVWTGAGPDIGLLLALVASSRLYLGTDTGPMHFAAALGVPVVALFGGGHWPRFLPRARRSFVATRRIPCFGCGWDCWLDEAACLTTVSTDTFAGALDWILGDGPDERRVDTGPALDPLAERLVEGGLAGRARVREEAFKVESMLREQLAVSQANAKARLEDVRTLVAQIEDAEHRLAALDASYQAGRTTLLAQVEDLHARLIESDADRSARGALIEQQSAVLAEQRRILAKRSVRVLRKLRLA